MVLYWLLYAKNQVCRHSVSRLKGQRCDWEVDSLGSLWFYIDRFKQQAMSADKLSTSRYLFHMRLLCAARYVFSFVARSAVLFLRLLREAQFCSCVCCAKRCFVLAFVERSAVLFLRLLREALFCSCVCCAKRCFFRERGAKRRR